MFSILWGESEGGIFSGKCVHNSVDHVELKNNRLTPVRRRTDESNEAREARLAAKKERDRTIYASEKKNNPTGLLRKTREKVARHRKKRSRQKIKDIRLHTYPTTTL